MANGERLLSDIEMLPSSPTSIALAILAEEEFAKGFLLMLIEQGVIPWNNAIWRATRDHSCKHLLTVLMDYADPEIEEVLVSIKSFEHRHESKMKLLDEIRSLTSLTEAADPSEMTALIEKQKELWREIAALEGEQEREEAFPPHVADAINILRHTKIGRWERGYHYYFDRCDAKAQAIADGAIDREKQRALYVCISRSGAVCSKPNDEIGSEELIPVLERSRKMGNALSQLLEYGRLGIEFERLIKNLKVMFASPEELKQLLS